MVRLEDAKYKNDNDNDSSSSSDVDDDDDDDDVVIDDNRRRKGQKDEQQQQQQQKVKEQKEQTVSSKRTKLSLLSTTPLVVAPVIQHDSKSIGAVAYSSGQISNHPIIILLDQATLETIKNKNNVYELLNCDDHRDICKKKLHQDPNMFRPDIVHQELLSILDSPLNKAGLVKVYIRTTKRILIDINPSIRIPRTYKRFAGLMVQLLHTMKIKAGTESTTLLRIIKNPFSQYLPPNTTVYGLECSGTLYSPISFVQANVPSTIPKITTTGNTNNTSSSTAAPICFIIGAMSNGNITFDDHPYIQEMIKISDYPLSGAAAVSRLVSAIEYHWGII